MLLQTRTNPQLSAWLAGELAEVESLFAAELLSDLPCVNGLVDHVERYRGKMLRPTLVLLSGAATSPSGRTVTDDHRAVATVVEMVHMATLVHDDILDEAQVRRRGSTINQLDGNETAVMLGDYLISHAYHLCSSIGRPVRVADQVLTAGRLIADTTNTVCEGELLQLANRHNRALDAETYFEIIRRKTASLCGTCCRLGALLHDASPGPSAALADGLATYGENVGIAFQIIDDLLDLLGNEDTVGKTLGMDLQKGKLTLPLIRHLETSDGAARRRLLDLLEQPASNGRDREQTEARIRKIIQSSGAPEAARQHARDLVALGKDALEPLPESPARHMLLEMADAVVTRQF